MGTPLPTANSTVEDARNANADAEAAGKNAKKESYEALTPVHHNGVLYRIGAEIKLIEADAKRLLAAGIVKIKAVL